MAKEFCVDNGARHPAEQAKQKFATLGFPLTLLTSYPAGCIEGHASHTSGRFWGVMSENSQIETLGVPWRRLKMTAYFDEAFDFPHVCIRMDRCFSTLCVEVCKAPRSVMVGNPDIVAPREDHLSLEPGYYAHEISRKIGLNAEFFESRLPTSTIWHVRQS